ncbi:hypothetical protein [Nocardiopsis alba]|uniref:hypothetical protein n=1 Tax=Nocardiopsis alba TaxID=53437 RepID=UPI001F48BC9F|nr:hypothetical protein [Nocardiopsis alba]
MEAPPSEEDGGTRVRGAVEGPEDRGGPAGASPREALASLWRSRNDRLLLTALAIVAVAVALKAYVLSASSFVEDDYLFFAAANTGGLTPEYLLDLHKGHFMPGAMFLVYLQNAFLPYHWGTAAGTMLVLQTVAILAFLRLLWELFGRRWALLIPLTVYASAPLTIPVLGWWAAALNAVPFQLAIVLALLWTVRHLRTGVTMYAWWAAGAVVFGMLFSVKALFLPPLLFAFAVAFLYPGGLARSARYAFWLDRRYWLGMAALSLGYLALYLLRQRAGDGSEGASVPVWEAASGLMRRMVVEVFPTGALGGPYVWRPITPTGGLVDPLGPVLIGAWIVFVAIVVTSLLLRRRAWRAWALLAGHLVFVDVVPTVIARGHMYGEVGADPRYVADAALVFALVLALAFLPVKEERAREHVGNAGRGTTGVEERAGYGSVESRGRPRSWSPWSTPVRRPTPPTPTRRPSTENGCGPTWPTRGPPWPRSPTTPASTAGRCRPMSSWSGTGSADSVRTCWPRWPTTPWPSACTRRNPPPRPTCSMTRAFWWRPPPPPASTRSSRPRIRTAWTAGTV